MDDYNRYVTAVNKIFDYTEKMRAGWNNLDNRNYIDSINEYKSIVTSQADAIRKPPSLNIQSEGSSEDVAINIGNEAVPTETVKENTVAQVDKKVAPAEVAPKEEPPAPQNEIKTFSPHPSPAVSMGIPDLSQMGGFPGIKEAAKIPVVEALPIPKANTEV